MSKDQEFWKEHGGVGLVWSNPDADDDLMITKALLNPSFHLLLDIAARFGLERLKSRWELLRKSSAEFPFPEEQEHVRRAEPIVTRCLAHMEEALK